MAAQKNTIPVKECDIVSNVRHAAEIFFENGDFIRNVILCSIRDEGKTEDLFQDFFLSLVSRPIPPDVRNLKSYIYKALINDISDRIRYIERYRALTHKYASYCNEVVNNRSAENALIEKEQTEKMIELIEKRVAKREARAIAMRYCDNLCVGEVASRMGINKRSVSRYISAGLRKVRQFLVFGQGD